MQQLPARRPLHVLMWPPACRAWQGRDVYGDYMREVLAGEGVRTVEPVAPQQLPPDLDTTLICFVLVAPDGKHAFCRCATGAVPG